MCGIELLVLSVQGVGDTMTGKEQLDDWEQKYHMDQVMKERGPDYQAMKCFFCTEHQTYWAGSSVLSLRGKETTPQPLCNETEDHSSNAINGDFLCWNGEIFSGSVGVEENENDGRNLFQRIQSIIHSNESSNKEIPKIFSSVHGPFAFCYYDSKHQTLWFGRDPMGRRSLLLHRSNSADLGELEFMLCSVLSKEIESKYPMEEWVEVPVDCIFSVQFPVAKISQEKPAFALDKTAEDNNGLLFSYYFESIESHPRQLPQSMRIASATFVIEPKTKEDKPFELTVPEMFLPYGTRNIEYITDPEEHTEAEFTTAKEQFCLHLGEAVRRRVQSIPDPHPLPIDSQYGAESRLAVMFSGGIDSMLVAALATKHFPKGEPIDLLNVAFGEWPFSVPDRITGREGLKELKAMDPERKWNFVEINITKAELEEHQEELYSHVFPRISVMDMTIGPALWFGARGKGIILRDESLCEEEMANYSPYHSTSKVLLMGNGADEQLGGYGRHRTAHKHRGMEGLQLELNKDTSRIWIRNLGRDDRVISSLSKESRYPFLDYDFMTFLTHTPTGLVCDYSKPPGEGDKRILREAAASLGLTSSTRFAKRAIQFGSRISHLTKRKKGGHIHFQGYS